MKMKRTILIMIAVALVGTACWFAIVWLAGARARPCGGGRRGRCMSNLAQIGKASKMYQMDHADQWPPTLADLVPDYIGPNPRIFWCPSCGRPTGALTNLMDWTSYVCVPLASNAPPQVVQAFCPPENHAGKGANVLFADGSVTWESTDAFDELIREQGLTDIREKHQQHLRHVRK